MAVWCQVQAASGEEASRAHPAQPAGQRHQARAGRHGDMVGGDPPGQPLLAGRGQTRRGALPGAPELVSRVRGSAPEKCEDFCRGD